MIDASNYVKITNYSTFAARLIAGVIFIPLLTLISFFLFEDAMKGDVEAILVLILWPISMFGYGFMLYTITLWIEIGPSLRGRKIFGIKDHDWNSVEDVVVYDVRGKMGISHTMAAVRLVGGGTYELKLDENSLAHLRHCATQHSVTVSVK
jgi:hypothetical protein